MSAIAVAALPYACSSFENGGSSSAVGGAGGATSFSPGGGHGTVTHGAGGGGVGGAGVDDLACVISKQPPTGMCVTVTPGTGGAGGGSGPAGGAGPGATSTASTGTGMAGGGGAGGGSTACSNVFNPSACADCVVHYCCDQTVACEQTDGCIACFVGDSSATGCHDDPILTPLGALQSCEANYCGSVCGVTLEYHCNPVTNVPCDTANGYACDLSGEASFECFPPPNTQKLCETCSVTNARPYCKPGMHCVEENAGAPTGFCGRYCCNDSECCPDEHPNCGNSCDHFKLLGPGVRADVGICTSG